MTTPASTTHTLQRPGGRIAYDVSGDGPLVVCVPGMGDLRSVYRFLVPALVDAGYRVATMDLRGHGESDTTFDRYDDVAAASDILALVEALGDGSATVVGNSMGAGAAVIAAADAPDRVSDLVLVGPFVREAPVGLLAKWMFRLALLRPWGRRAWDAWYRRLYPSHPPADLDAHRARIRESLRAPDKWRAFIATTHTDHGPAEARLSDVHARTLVVMGERDSDFPDPSVEARWIGERLGGEVLLVPGAGHYPQAEAPDVVAAAIVRFLAEAERPADARSTATRSAA
jgi:pimeloyl-ACP methyl ester carboxylesterase